MKIGDRNESINFGWMEVVSEPYDSGTKRKDMKVDVRFDNTGEIRRGILTKYFLLGAVRDGKWVLRFKMNGEFIQTRLGKLHNTLTQRTKVGGAQQKGSPTYIGVGISSEFSDAQAFCDWVVEQPGWGLGYSLDKDLLSGDNKIYSPVTCVFIPQIINSAIVLKDSKKTFVTKSSKGCRLGFQLGGKNIVFRNIPSEEECVELYKNFKEGYVQRLAEEYREGISDQAYRALMCWQCKI